MQETLRSPDKNGGQGSKADNVGLHRFEVLDSLRGICACLVAMFHLQTTSFLTLNPLIRNAWQFVDLFFVLSGFVISACYGDRLRTGYPLMKYTILIFGRIYPLHFFVLMLFVWVELIKPYLGFEGIISEKRFVSPKSLPELFESLALVNIFGLSDTLTWNWPSWSISAEFWTYLLSALVFRLFTKGWLAIAAFTCVAAPIWMWIDGAPYLDRTYNLALVRSVYGFSLGAIAYHLHQGRYWSMPDSVRLVTVFEVALVIAVVVFVTFVGRGPLSLLGPPIFMVVVLIFASEKGQLSRILKAPVFLMLGTLSYSIYMIHVFVEYAFLDVLALLSKNGPFELVSMQQGTEGMKKALGTPDQPVVAAILGITALVLVVVASAITYRLIENPSRQFSRRIAARMS